MYTVICSSPPERLGWRDVLATLGRGIILNQLIALAISLLLAGESVHPWRTLLLCATVISQSIGLLCEIAAVLAWPALGRLPLRRQILLGVLAWCLCGVVGAEVAAWLLLRVFHVDLGGSHVIRAAVGAVVAMLVGTTQQAIASLTMTLDDTRRELQERELLQAQLMRAKTEAELAAIRSRIDPHFLFNTLNSIASLIREDPSRAETATLELSSLFRYALQAHRQSLVDLEEEIEIVRRYLEIEKLRLGSRLTFEIAMDADLGRRQVPALLLQPLVENAVRHGIAPSVTGGMVRVRGWRDGERMLLSVADSGLGQGQAGGTGEGLDNVRRRLQAVYGGRASVSLGRDGAWTETLVTLPGD